MERCEVPTKKFCIEGIPRAMAQACAAILNSVPRATAVESYVCSSSHVLDPVKLISGNHGFDATKLTLGHLFHLQLDTCSCWNRPSILTDVFFQLSMAMCLRAYPHWDSALMTLSSGTSAAWEPRMTF